MQIRNNRPLHPPAIPLCSIAADGLRRYVRIIKEILL